MSALRTGRRGLLGGAAALTALAAPSAAQAAQHPDADLLRHCDAYHAAQAESRRLNALPTCLYDGPEWDAQSAAWKAAVLGVLSCAATTQEGLRAKAAVVRYEVHDAGVPYVNGTIATAEWHERLAYSLTGDILGRAYA
jgi:hypothetical protein